MAPHYLLDTHVVLRWLADPKKLSRDQTRILDEAVRHGAPVALTAITLLEIASLFSNEIRSTAAARIHHPRLLTPDQRIIESKLVSVIE